MAKLYPPKIEGRLPAFYDNLLIIPFEMNRAVSVSQVSAMRVKIKTVQSNKTILTKSTEFTLNEISCEFTDEEVKKFIIGQFYKVQIAYVNGTEEGYYSTVGVVKYTAKPEVIIADLTAYAKNFSYPAYVGVYRQEKDYSEKVYSYNFKLWNNEDVLIKDTGEQIHAYTGDTLVNESSDVFNYPVEIKEGEKFKIQYTITTTNGMVISSPKYKITKYPSIDCSLNSFCDLKASVNDEDGYIELTFSKKEGANARTVAGHFALLRREKRSNIWDTIYKFDIFNTYPWKWKWKDFTACQGVEYVYAIQQYNNYGLYSEKMLSNSISTAFEHAYLFDGERQLKIKFNPKVSSFKTTVLESKMDTLGSKYPYFFRNGMVEYKEFPISGLISHFSDESGLFMENDFTNNNYRNGHETPLDKVRTTNLTDDNILFEREFKLEVLDWLNNGKPKFFKSAVEGNYIVRLMNVSLTPTDALGRMLHTFNCTAYELAEINYENLLKYKFININNIADKLYKYWVTVHVDENYIANNLETNKQEGVTKNIIKNGRKAVEIYVRGAMPGDKMSIQYLKSSTGIWRTIYFGATGEYRIDNAEEIAGIYLYKANKGKDITVTYGFFEEMVNTMNHIEKFDVYEVPAQQIYGSEMLYETKPVYYSKLGHVYLPFELIDNFKTVDIAHDVFEYLSDIKKQRVQYVDYIQVKKRPIQFVFTKQNNIKTKNGIVDLEENDLYLSPYLDKEANKIQKESLMEDVLYKIYKTDVVNYNEEVDRHIDDFISLLLQNGECLYLDGKTQKLISENNYSTCVHFAYSSENDSYIDLNKTEIFRISQIKLEQLLLGTGVMAEMGYMQLVVKYDFEDDIIKRDSQKYNWQGHLDTYLYRTQHVNEIDPNYGDKDNGNIISEDLVQITANKVDEAYDALLIEVNKEIDKILEEGGYVENDFR